MWQSYLEKRAYISQHQLNCSRGVIGSNQRNLPTVAALNLINTPLTLKLLPSGRQTSFGRPMGVYLKSGLHMDDHWTSDAYWVETMNLLMLIMKM